MPEILHEFPIHAPASEVFAAITTPAGLDSWWTLHSTGSPVVATEYELDFGPGYNWRAVVTHSFPVSGFELTMTDADPDWQSSRIAFQLTEKAGVTQLSFQHSGWPEQNAHFRISSFCWAMYLRLLKRYCESGEVVPYEKRLDV